MFEQSAQRRIVKERPVPSRDLQPVQHVTPGLLRIESAKMVLHSDALPKRPVRAALKPFLQFGLAHKHDRQKVAVVELEVRKQPQFFNCRTAGHELGLVDDKHGPPAAGRRFLRTWYGPRHPRCRPFQTLTSRLSLILYNKNADMVGSLHNY